MTSAGSSLPTAWLAPPPGLLPLNQATKIEPVPIAISVTLTFIVGALVVILFSRKNKDVFLEDKMIALPENEHSTAASTAASRQGSPNISLPYDVQVPERFRALSDPSISQTRLPQPTQGSSTPNFSRPQPARRDVAPRWQSSEQKLDNVLGLNNDWERRHNTATSSKSPLGHKSYYEPMPPRKANYEYCDDDTLEDDEENSAYVPFPGSDMSDFSYDGGKYGFRREEGSRAADRDSLDFLARRSPFSLASKTRLGDAY